MNIFDKINKIGVVPVVSLDEPNLASKLATALCEGGLPIAEVTFRVNNVIEVMKQIKKTCPDMILGAGTVLTIEQVKRAIDAKCQFIVSPGFNPKVVEYCLNQNIAIIPGVATPTEIELAMSYGLTNLKFFPAELNGGLKYIKALCAPYTNVKFMPTGGINSNNFKEYLEFNKILAVGGTWIAKTDVIKSNNFDLIKKLALETSEVVKEVR